MTRVTYKRRRKYEKGIQGSDKDGVVREFEQRDHGKL